MCCIWTHIRLLNGINQCIFLFLPTISIHLNNRRRLARESDGSRDLSLIQKERLSVMNSTNPRVVLRNYIAQTAILAAEKGDFSEVRRLKIFLSFSKSPLGHLDPLKPVGKATWSSLVYCRVSSTKVFCNFTESEILQMTPLMFSAAQTQAEMHSMSLKLVSEKGDLLLMKMSLTGHSSSWLLCDFHPSKSDIFRNTLWVHVRVHKKST